MRSVPRRTMVSFHAHPDDEALLTGGTLARFAAAGHRVVLLVATAGEAGLTGGGEVGRRRRRELEASAEALGVERVEVLGYADSGWSPSRDQDPAPDRAFSRLDPEGPALHLAGILREEGAEVLTGYDAGGGYGHPDHVQVHAVARRAAALAGTPVLLEATLPREPLVLAARAVRGAGRVLPRLPVPRMPDLSQAYAPRAQITHRVDVRDHLDAKLAALRCHASQAEGDGGNRTLALLDRLPRPVQRRVLGWEHFVLVGDPHRLDAAAILSDLVGVSRSGPVHDRAASRG